MEEKEKNETREKIGCKKHLKNSKHKNDEMEVEKMEEISKKYRLLFVDPQSQFRINK